MAPSSAATSVPMSNRLSSTFCTGTPVSRENSATWGVMSAALPLRIRASAVRSPSKMLSASASSKTGSEESPRIFSTSFCVLADLPSPGPITIALAHSEMSDEISAARVGHAEMSADGAAARTSPVFSGATSSKRDRFRCAAQRAWRAPLSRAFPSRAPTIARCLRVPLWAS